MLHALLDNVTVFTKIGTQVERVENKCIVNVRFERRLMTFVCYNEMLCHLLSF